jgi:putative transposase
VLVVVGVNRARAESIPGDRERGARSTQSWREVLLSLKKRGLTEPPLVAVGDGALGFWAALEELYPKTRHQRKRSPEADRTLTHQRCWVHKSANVLNYAPKAVQPRMKKALHEIWMAETRTEARVASISSLAPSPTNTRRQPSAR